MTPMPNAPRTPLWVWSWVLVMGATVTPTATASPPVVGGNELVPNAWNLVNYIRDTYPAVSSIGGVRQDPLPDHPSGHAIDIMTYSDVGLGNTIFADFSSRASELGIRYILWQVPNHYNHLHVTVF